MSSTDDSSDSSGSGTEISPSVKIACQYIGIASFVGILLFFIIHYIKESICGRRQRQSIATSTTTTARAGPDRRNGGLDLVDISLLPKFIYRPCEKILRKKKHSHDHKGKLTLPAECAVCISELEDGDIVRVLPTCKHFFHTKCIDKWLCSHSTCPMCRAHPEPDKVKLGLVSASPPLSGLRRCGTMPERKDSINIGLCFGSPFAMALSRGGSPYWHGSVSLQGSPCMFPPARVVPEETRIEVRVLDDDEIGEISERES